MFLILTVSIVSIMLIAAILAVKIILHRRLISIFRKTFENLRSPICILDKKGKIIWKNEKFMAKFPDCAPDFEISFKPKKILQHIQVVYAQNAWILEHVKIHRHFAVIFQSIKKEPMNWWDTLPFPIAVLNKDDQIERGNHSLRKLIGVNYGYLRDFTEQFNAELASSEVGQELVWKSKLGHIPIITWIKSYGDDKILILENRTELIALKNQAQEAQHLQIMGQLTCGIIHDFNNLLTAISGFSELLESTLPDNEMLNEIKRNTNQAANLAKELLNFVRSKTVEQNLVEPAKFLLSRKTMLQKLLGETIVLEVIANEKETGLIDLSETQMEQIVLNMVLNSKDAMESGGKIRISLTKNVLTTPTTIHNRVLEPTKYFVIEISDNGNGINSENINKVFAPFFSTKTKGTGLGLASCMRIVEHVSGSIDFKTSTAGTSFFIFIPVSSQKKIAKEEEKVTVSTQNFSKKTLVLVEDEQVIRNLMQKTLTQAGYTIYAYSDGLEALKQAKDKHIDGLITDAILPGMDGIKLTNHFQKYHPKLPILIVSGYSIQDLTYNLPKNVHYLEKPFTLKILKEKVNAIFQDDNSSILND